MSLAREQVRRWVPPAVRMAVRPPPRWSIGVITTQSPLEIADTRAATPVLDAAALRAHDLRLVADPFALRRDGTWHLFMEALSRGRRTASIGLATSRDGATWTYHGPVLTESFHLSYPCLVEDDGQVFMVPESSTDLSLRLYRAVDFPFRWELEATLLTGAPYKDATPFRHGGRWWMLVETSNHRHDELRLFAADALRGPWTEHPDSPLVVADPSCARPAGRPLVIDGRLVRLAQDCGPAYGHGVRAFQITELDPERYREQDLGHLLRASGSGWAGRAVHHLDAHATTDGWVCFVDGHG